MKKKESTKTAKRRFRVCEKKFVTQPVCLEWISTTLQN
jgi:hypothetical protein